MKISVSAIFLLLSTVSMINAEQNPVSTGILTDREHYAPGEQVQITFAVENRGQQPVTLQFRTGQQYDVWVTFNGKEIWRWSKGRAFPQTFTSFTLAPGERRAWDLTWNQCDQSDNRVPPGSYQVWGQLLVDDHKSDPVHREMILGAGCM